MFLVLFLFLILPLLIAAGIAYLIAKYARTQLSLAENKHAKALSFLTFFISFLLIAGAFLLFLAYHIPFER
jgi:hypothetical protein